MASKGDAYASTRVPVSDSQAEARKMLRAHGAEQFTFYESNDAVGIEFVHAGHLVRLKCPMRSPEEALAADKRHVSRAEKEANAAEHEQMRVWRVLVWSLKARLVAVAEGVETFEQAFLAHLVDPATRQTVWEGVRAEVEAGALRLGGPGMPALGPGGRP